MFHTFDKNLHHFPALLAEHIMLSIAEGAQVADSDFSKRVILTPYDVSIFSIGVLGTLYYWLSGRSQTRRILYLWSDSSLYPGTIHVPSSSGTKQVLGKTISYDHDMIPEWRQSQLVRDDTYFSHSNLWYTHVHYLAFLNGIKVLPMVFAEAKDMRTYAEQVLLCCECGDTETVIVMIDTITFRIQETVGGPQILAFQKEYFARFDIFCTYCDRKAIVPNIMKVEIVQHHDNEPVYQGLLAL